MFTDTTNTNTTATTTTSLVVPNIIGVEDNELKSTGESFCDKVKLALGELITEYESKNKKTKKSSSVFSFSTSSSSKLNDHVALLPSLSSLLNHLNNNVAMGNVDENNPETVLNIINAEIKDNESKDEILEILRKKIPELSTYYADMKRQTLIDSFTQFLSTESTTVNNYAQNELKQLEQSLKFLFEFSLNNIVEEYTKEAKGTITLFNLTEKAKWKNYRDAEELQIFTKIGEAFNEKINSKNYIQTNATDAKNITKSILKDILSQIESFVALAKEAVDNDSIKNNRCFLQSAGGMNRYDKLSTKILKLLINESKTIVNDTEKQKSAQIKWEERKQLAEDVLVGAATVALLSLDIALNVLEFLLADDDDNHHHHDYTYNINFKI